MGSSDLFVPGKAPNIAPDGTLSFILAQNKFGEASFSVTLEDSAGVASEASTFTLVVTNVNHAPTFYIPQRIVGYEGTPFSAKVCPLVSPGDFEQEQQLSFVVTTADPAYFTSPPGIDSAGLLSFVPKRYVYGTTTMNVTLVDDGGRVGGGVDASPTVTVSLDLLPVNQGPTFALPESIFVLEKDELFRQEGTVQLMTAGPDNEIGVCGTFPGDCARQEFIFEFSTASNPDIFSVLPRLDEP